MEHTGFPSDETLAAFIDGELDADTRQRVVEHMTDCAECYATFLTGTEFTAEEGEASSPALLAPARVPRPVSRQRTIMLAIVSVAAAVVIAFGLWQWIDSRRSGVSALVAASDSLEYRPVEARLAGGFPYKPFKKDRNAEENGDRKTNWTLITGVGNVVERTDGTSPESLRTRAIAHVLLGDYQEAVTTFEELLVKETGRSEILEAIKLSTNATLLNDLSAAYFARWARHAGPADLQRASEAAERAWKLQQTPEIAWNRALTLQKLHLNEPARAAWQDYLRLDPSSQWSEEARTNVARLSSSAAARDWSEVRPALSAAVVSGDVTTVRRIAQQYPAYSREHAEDALLAQCFSVKDADHRDTCFATLRALAEEVERTSGDRFLRDTIVHIAAASTTQPSRLASAHRDYAAARLLGPNRPAEALPRFRRAAADLQSVGSPFAPLAQLRYAVCVHASNDYDAAIAALPNERAVEELVRRRYYGLAGRIEWMRGTTRVELGLPDLALASYDRALVSFVRSGDRGGETQIRTRSAQAAQRLGDSDAAWRNRFEALKLAANAGASPEQSHFVLTEAALALQSEGYDHLALAVLDRLVTIDRRSSTKSNLCTALTWRSLHLAEQGMRSAAIRDFNEALARCAEIQDVDVKARAEANLSLAMAKVRPDAPPASIANLTAAIEFAERSGSRFRRATLYADRARVHLAAQQLPAARDDVEHAIVETAWQLEHVRQAEFRVSLVESAREVVAAAIDVHLAGGDAAGAFDRSEWFRHALMQLPWARVREGDEHALGADAIRAALPPRTAVLALHLSQTRVVAFVVTPQTVIARAAAVAGESLRAEAERFAQAVRNGDPDAALYGRTVYTQLVRPVVNVLRGIETLVIVTEPALAGVPFVALPVAPQRHLIDDFSIAWLPSATTLARTAARCPARSGPTLIAAPSIERLGRWSDLPATEREALDVAKLYPSATVLRSVAARRDAFLDFARDAAAIHFAGHGSAGAQTNAALSALVLHGASGAPELLYARTIANSRYDACRVVVLAGCRTAAGPGSSQSNGNLAQAFLAAGVPNVVGSLWDLADEAGRVASVALHRELVRTHDVAKALRGVQQMLKTSTDPELHSPRTWAALTLVGGACNG